MIERRLLAIYLQDHRAGSMGGLELARRAAGSNRGSAIGEAMEALVVELEAEIETLEALMAELGIRRNNLKILGAWTGEKLGRLKLNGRLTGQSPLSPLVELELLRIGITGKLGMWQALEETLGPRLTEFDLPGLIEQAERQRTVVEGLRLEAARVAFGP